MTEAANTTLACPVDVKICEPGGSGLVLPLFGSEEWPMSVQAVFYTIGLLWCFLGVGIISDIFMGAIERITSKKKRILDKETGRKRTVLVWNDTVANLTLMALGSSAPEILLSMIETFSNNFYSGELGPATIVGSAAFNLFCISAVCICAIPDGEVRKINDLAVYSITATCSVWAYVWLLVILMLSSKDMLMVWEAELTFLFFPFLVFLSYLADVGYFSKRDKTCTTSRVLLAEMCEEEIQELAITVRKDHGAELSDELVLRFIELEHLKHTKTRAEYRVAATRGLTGGKKIDKGPNAANEVEHAVGTGDDPLAVEEQKRNRHACKVTFVSDSYAVLESAGKVKITITRTKTDAPCQVKYTTVENTAKVDINFKHVEEIAKFEVGQDSCSFFVEVVDNQVFEEDKDFTVVLSDPDCCAVGTHAKTTVTIVEDDLPGIIAFVSEEIKVTNSENHEIEVEVKRHSGGTGEITCQYHTEDDSAKAGVDYEGVEESEDNIVTFADGQLSATITLSILKNSTVKTDLFRLFLKECTGGAKFDKKTDGGEESCICSIFLQASIEKGQSIARIGSQARVEWNRAQIGNANYKDQFIAALYVNGSKLDQAQSSWADVVIHVFCLPWKLLFALVPPADFCGGWLCFCMALVMIAVVTAVIGDMASLLGCSYGLTDMTTAITFVALGTSLPDTFASMSAAQQDPYADASIGNVTGSNSVNVFLGLGIPWGIAAVYWRIAFMFGWFGQNAREVDGVWESSLTLEWRAKWLCAGQPGLDVIKSYPDGGFVAIAGGLSTNVGIFCINALICIGLMCVRRKLYGGELGGPKKNILLGQYVSGVLCVSLWLIYLAVSIIFEPAKES